MSEGSEDAPKEPLTPNMIASIMWASAKGDPKLPKIDQVCNDFPTSVTLACRDMFVQKLEAKNEGGTPSYKKKQDNKAIETIIRAIEKRYSLKLTCVRSPCPDIHRLLKEEK